MESGSLLSERGRGSKRKTGWWIAVGLVGACCAAVLLMILLKPGNTLKVDFVVMKDAVVVTNGDDFLYERLHVTMSKGSISNTVSCTLGPGQSAEMRPRFTPEYIQVEVLRNDVVWRAIWREHVEGKDEQARSLRKRYMMDIVLDQAYGKIDDAGHRNEHGKVASRDDGSESSLAGSQNPSSQEPSFEGRSLSQWISLYFVTDEQGIEMANSWQERRVDDAVQHMGTNALRCLMQWLQYE